MPVEGTNAVIMALQSKQIKGAASATVHVGFLAVYASFVHENMEMPHPNGGQAKFLEQPSRTERDVMKQIIRRALIAKEPLPVAMERAGMYLLEKARELVPVKTGHLKASGFVEVLSS